MELGRTGRQRGQNANPGVAAVTGPYLTPGGEDHGGYRAQGDGLAQEEGERTKKVNNRAERKKEKNGGRG